MDILDWMHQKQQESSLSVEKVPLSKARDWAVRADGTVRRKDSKFYQGVIIQTSTGNFQWDQLMLEPTSSHESHGVIFLLQIKDAFLVQAKAEPGNHTPGHVIATTTVQASHDNLASNKIPYAALARNYDKKYLAPQDAGMLFGKFNEFRHSHRDSLELEIMPGFYLASKTDIRRLAAHNLVSEYLLQSLGLLFLN